MEMVAARLSPDGRPSLAEIPMGRLGAANDVVGAAAYLASPAARWVTGIVLPLDGGSSLPHVGM